MHECRHEAGIVFFEALALRCDQQPPVPQAPEHCIEHSLFVYRLDHSDGMIHEDAIGLDLYRMKSIGILRKRLTQYNVRLYILQSLANILEHQIRGVADYEDDVGRLGFVEVVPFDQFQIDRAQFTAER